MQIKPVVAGIVTATLVTVSSATPPPPGTILDDRNVGAFSDYLDETLVELIGDGHFTLEVTDYEAIEPDPAYAERKETALL